MAKRVQILGFAHSVILTTIGFVREMIIDTDQLVLTIHDGVTAGGIRIAREDLTNCLDATETVAGRMGTADKIKLDGIAASATNSPLDTATPVASTYAGSGTAGVATKASRSDHKHAFPALTAVNPAAVNPANAAAPGTGTNAAREDHVHAVTGFPTSTSAHGNISADIILTNSSNTYHTFTPTVEGLYLILSDATTETQATPGRFIGRNDGIYWMGIKNSLGVIVSFIMPRTSITVDLASISTAAGPWKFRVGALFGDGGLFTGIHSAHPVGAANGSANLCITSIALTDNTFLLLQPDSTASTTAIIKGSVLVVSPTSISSPSTNLVSLVTDLNNNVSDQNGFCADIIDATRVFLLWNSTADSKAKCAIITISANVPSLGTPADVGTGVAGVVSCSVNSGGATALCAWKTTTVMHVAHVGISGAAVSPGTEQTFTPASTLNASAINARTNSATQGFIFYGGSSSVGVFARLINTNGATTTPTTVLGTTENSISTLTQFVNFSYAADATHAVVSYDWGNSGTSTFGGRAKVLTLGASDFSVISSEIPISSNGSNVVDSNNVAPHCVKISATCAYVFGNQVTIAHTRLPVIAYPLTFASGTLTPLPPIVLPLDGRAPFRSNAGCDVRTIASSGGRVLLDTMGNLNSGGGPADHVLNTLYIAEAA